MKLPDLNLDDLDKLTDLTLKQEADPRILNFNEKLGKAIATLYKAIPKQIVLPRIFNITGKVSVSKVDEMPAIAINNFSQLAQYFKALDVRIGQLATAISVARGAKIEMPKIEFPKIEIPKNTDLKESLDKIEKALKSLANKEQEYPTTISIDNFPPQMTPQPVTNININPLRGLIHTTSVNVTSDLTLLPSYGVLKDRRSIMVFNNDSTNAIYIGGSDVTINNGLPVLAQTYSPSIDAGPNMVLYGIANSPINVRVIEISNDSGN